MCLCFLQKFWLSSTRADPRLLRHFSWSQQRAYSLSFEAHFASLDKKVPVDNGRPKAKPESFRSLGLHPPIVSALRTAFPDVKHPTKNQAVLIPAVLAGRDVFVEDQTGSGKSFGLVLALLNKPRAEKRRPAITAIFIVPHRELAYQFHGWVERMFAPAASIPGASVSSIAQILVRDSQGPGLPLLRENPPHLLFCTPQALMDAWREQPDVLQLRTLSAIVIDEADNLIPTVGYSTSRKRRVLKQQQHPGDTREFLDLVYGKNARPFVDDEDMPPERAGPQLILSSATLPNHLVEYVSDESGWMNRDNWVSISGASSDSRSRQPRSRVTHSVLVVSEDDVRNIAGAKPSPPGGFESFDTPTDTDEGSEDPVEPALVKKYMETASPFNPLALETIAMIFAADVPSTALLVIPATSPVQRAIFELRELGVNARGLDLLKTRTFGGHTVRANPILLVSTSANTRGLDVLGLTHVFVLGIPSGGATAYTHIAGRVGRLESRDKRRTGKVVMVVGPQEEDAARELLKSVNCDATCLSVV